MFFNDRSRVVHDREDIRRVAPMTKRDYLASGSTALLDAVGDAIKHIGNIHKYARGEDVPENTLFIITTDGMENASRRYSAGKIKQMIENQKEKYGWEFIFMGANIDAADFSRSIGIDESRTVNYNSDSAGTRLNYETIGKTIKNLRANSEILPNWKADIEEDFRKRGER